jgi:hypothetical protein
MTTYPLPNVDRIIYYIFARTYSMNCFQQHNYFANTNIHCCNIYLYTTETYYVNGILILYILPTYTRISLKSDFYYEF